MQIKNLILGAGISGLGAASVLDKENTIIFEKESYFGGLCNSFEINGFRFDTAVHFSFSEKEEVRCIFDSTEYFSHKPNAYNYVNGLWLKHPVQNNLFKLSTEEKINCIKYFVEKPKFDSISNYEEWLMSNYGNYIYEKFHYKYTNKYWCKHPKELSIDWIGNRLNIPKIEAILFGAFSENTGIDYYAKEMRYPTEGGYKQFLVPLTKDIKIDFNKEATKIDLKNKVVYFKDNTLCSYQNIISSIPITELVNLIDDIPPIVKNASDKLMTTSVVLASVGFNKDNIPPYLWFYIYDEDILPARAYSPSLKSKDNVPKGCSSMQFEIYYTKEKPLNMNEGEIIKHIEQILIKMNLCTKEEIMFIDIKNIKHANVVFYNGMEEDKKIVKDYLNKKGVHLIGRFGEWDYLWSDQSLMSGLNICRELEVK